MTVFQNPANGYQETVNELASVGVFFFGALYLGIKGLWGHVFIWLMIVAPLSILTGGSGVIIGIPLASIIYAVRIQSILRKKYLRDGWIEVGSEKNATHKNLNTKEIQTSYRLCPFCSEKILPAAIICKHCKSELTPVILSGCTGQQRTCLRFANNEAPRCGACD